ncbi:helix-turn-helix transcriptional regulator [Alicyclobacillus acidoterrestris]|uniref:Helix-turn-helix transcriptional regulator n=1 Tax=Alicyclobacillus acidoterrestris (strain ATCC 49025 / DSM 3922 / CIP 106132 / NCIMB 13137 / GD3B) TaxID=1356854 RepID=A0A9E6ZHK6_ALIAG|nr:helix-turn-helix transcriptional regulator [Alicyclobacillus acidoterrestris]UNO49018.1 helix-turn-helix transcriptional regulator [Alicyclobacillus acidoterrestris]
MVKSVRKSRIEIGLSVEEAAIKLGISVGYLSDIERAKRSVTAKRATEIASLYNSTVNELFIPVRYMSRYEEGESDARQGRLSCNP